MGWKHAPWPKPCTRARLVTSCHWLHHDCVAVWAEPAGDRGRASRLAAGAHSAETLNPTGSGQMPATLREVDPAMRRSQAGPGTDPKPARAETRPVQDGVGAAHLPEAGVAQEGGAREGVGSRRG